MAVEVRYIQVPVPTTCFHALNNFDPESARNHAVIPGQFHLDAQNPAVDPTYWPPNVTGCRKIPTAKVGIKPGPRNLNANIQKPVYTARQKHSPVTNSFGFSIFGYETVCRKCEFIPSKFSDSQ